MIKKAAVRQKKSRRADEISERYEELSIGVFHNHGMVKAVIGTSP